MDLGDQDSWTYKLLLGAGVAKNILKSAYELGIFLLRNLPF
ncbi:hypothetical protein ACFLZV_06200 [Candidatus Margulisiibacteriota bacterium]